MMRVNAPIPALLALAVLCFFPVDSVAKPAHHHVHKAVVAAPVHRESVTRPGTSSGHNPTSRVRGQHAPTYHHINSPTTARVSQPGLTASTPTPRAATSDDFIKAAKGTADGPDHVAANGTSHPEELNKPSPHSPSRRPDSVAKPVSVVSVRRPSTERPQLPSVEEAASTPVILPTLYNKRGRLIVPPPLKGSHDILVHQNQVADHDGLDRIQSDEDLLNMRSERLLVSLPATSALQVDERLPRTVATVVLGQRSSWPPWPAPTTPTSIRRCKSTRPSAPSNSSST